MTTVPLSINNSGKATMFGIVIANPSAENITINTVLERRCANEATHNLVTKYTV